MHNLIDLCLGILTSCRILEFVYPIIPFPWNFLKSSKTSKRFLLGSILQNRIPSILPFLSSCACLVFGSTSRAEPLRTSYTEPIRAEPLVGRTSRTEPVRYAVLLMFSFPCSFPFVLLPFTSPLSPLRRRLCELHEYFAGDEHRQLSPPTFRSLPAARYRA